MPTPGAHSFFCPRVDLSTPERTGNLYAWLPLVATRGETTHQKGSGSAIPPGLKLLALPRNLTVCRGAAICRIVPTNREPVRLFVFHSANEAIFRAAICGGQYNQSIIFGAIKSKFLRQKRKTRLIHQFPNILSDLNIPRGIQTSSGTPKTSLIPYKCPQRP